MAARKNPYGPDSGKMPIPTKPKKPGGKRPIPVKPIKPGGKKPAIIKGTTRKYK